MILSHVKYYLEAAIISTLVLKRCRISKSIRNLQMIISRSNKRWSLIKDCYNHNNMNVQYPSVHLLLSYFTYSLSFKSVTLALSVIWWESEQGDVKWCNWRNNRSNNRSYNHTSTEISTLVMCDVIGAGPHGILHLVLLQCILPILGRCTAC